MKKLLLAYSVFLIVSACSGVKKTQKALHTGNYDQAISIALNKIRGKKDKKKSEPYIELLEESFAKAVAKDQKTLAYLKSDANPSHLEKSYKIYLKLKNRQQRIRPVLPLFLRTKGKRAKFTFQNYDQILVQTKSKLSNYLYQNAKKALESPLSKLEYRRIYDDLNYLIQINPNFRDTGTLLKKAHDKGTDYVRVSIKNHTRMVIPRRLESDLLNFGTYGLQDHWTVYHNKPQRSIRYDYAIEVSLREINISPEQIKERQLEKERLVKDGWEYKVNAENEYILDEQGERIKIDKMVKVTCAYYEFTQFKAVNVVGNVQYKNLKNRQLLQTFPLASEYVFEHVYATYSGDKRALEDGWIRFLRLQSVPFPTNEQMVYDTGEDLKKKLKSIITNYRFLPRA